MGLAQGAGAQQAGVGDLKVLRGSKASPGTEAELLLQPGTLQDQNHLGTAAPAFVFPSLFSLLWDKGKGGFLTG